MKKRIMAMSVLLAASSAFAVNNEWKSSAVDNDWNNAANWNKSRVPNVASNDTAIVRLTSNVDITMNATPSVNPKEIWLGANNGAGTLHTLTIANSTVGANKVRVGYDRTAWTGAGAGNGLLTINGASSSLAVSGNLEIGAKDGTATSGSTGVVVLNDGTLSATQILLGTQANATGTLTINGGAVTTGNFKLASNGASDGTLNLYGGTLDVTGGWSGAGTDHLGISLGSLTAKGDINGKFVNIANEGHMTVLGGLLDDSAFTSTYTSNSGSFASAGGIAKWGYDATSNKTAVWSVIPEPATLSMVALLGGGMLFVRRRFMA